VMDNLECRDGNANALECIAEKCQIPPAGAAVAGNPINQESQTIMRVFQIEGDWGIDHLRVSVRPDPHRDPARCWCGMKASSLNYRDLVVPDRGYGSHTGTLPLIPLSDGVGEVTAVGPGVQRVVPGDRVCPTFFQRWTGGEPNLDRLTSSLAGPIDGTMAGYMCLSEDGVVKVSAAHLSDIEAATLPCAALTAWSALTGGSAIKPGERVLVQGCGAWRCSR